MSWWPSVALLFSLAVAAGKMPAFLQPLLHPPAGAAAVQAIDISPTLPALDAVDVETSRAIRDAVPQIQILVNPLMGRVIAASKGAPDLAARKNALVREASARARAWSGRAATAAVSALAAMIGFSVLFLATGVKGLSRVLGEWGLRLSRGWVFLLSTAWAAGYLGAGVNLMEILPTALWTVPFFGMLGGAGVLRAVDLNHPVWNRLLMGLAFPLATGIFVLLWGRAVGRPLF